MGRRRPAGDRRSDRLSDVITGVGPARVAIIGGGVSGSSAAIRFAHHGHDVTLFEKQTFPREKVCGCCLGAAGLSALDAMGLGDGVRQLGRRVDAFEGHFVAAGHPSSARIDRFRVPIVPGTAISRAVLDSFLIDAAAMAGVSVEQPVEAQVVVADASTDPWRSPSVRTRIVGGDWQASASFDLVLVAGGLTGRCFQGGLGDEWAWIDPPSGPLGLSTHVPGDHPVARAWRIDPGIIQMIAGDDGYLGVVRLPGDGLDLAAAIDPASSWAQSAITPSLTTPSHATGRQRLIDRVFELSRHGDCVAGSVEDDLREFLNRTASWLTTPPLRRLRRAGRDNVAAIGDAVGYVEPLTGEGMTWGIESGIAVADLWQDFGRGGPHCGQTGFDRVNFSSTWQSRRIRMLRRRTRVCDFVTRSLRRAWVRRGASWVLGRADWIARPMTHQLSRGPRFATTTTKSPSPFGRDDSSFAPALPDLGTHR